MGDRRLSTRRWKWLLAGLFVAALIVADKNGWLIVAPNDDLTIYNNRLVHVTRIIDGDTVEIDVADAVNHRPRTHVRLIGIDCPEMAMRGKPAEWFAPEATALATDLALDAWVTLRLEPASTRGNYGRLLAHIDLADGRSLARLLLEEGLGVADDGSPHSRLNSLAQGELIARRAGRGVWSETGE